MNSVRQWAISLCYLLVLCQIAYMLAPKSQINKVIKYVIGLFLLIGILIPTRKLRFDDFSYEFNDMQSKSQRITEEITQINENYVYKIGENNIHVLTKNCLNEIGVTECEVEAAIEKDRQTGEAVLSLNLSVPEKYKEKSKEILSEVEESIGVTPQIVFNP
ncbi:MAG: stage III sporulation protein AF [Oscillospiraceae bacterium]